MERVSVSHFTPPSSPPPPHRHQTPLPRPPERSPRQEPRADPLPPRNIIERYNPLVSLVDDKTIAANTDTLNKHETAIVSDVRARYVDQEEGLKHMARVEDMETSIFDFMKVATRCPGRTKIRMVTYFDPSDSGHQLYIAIKWETHISFHKDEPSSACSCSTIKRPAQARRYRGPARNLWKADCKGEPWLRDIKDLIDRAMDLAVRHVAFNLRYLRLQEPWRPPEDMLRQEERWSEQWMAPRKPGDMSFASEVCEADEGTVDECEMCNICGEEYGSTSTSTDIVPMKLKFGATASARHASRAWRRRRANVLTAAPSSSGATRRCNTSAMASRDPP
jgi:hypothetical protein